MTGAQGTYDAVKEYYGRVLQNFKDLKTNACTAAGRPHQIIRELLTKVPKEVTEKFYGCGAPLPFGIEGLRVLDLGSGSGRDSYVSSALVGEHGTVTGIDMTRNQLDVANRHKEEYTQSLDYAQPNMHFIEGHIEYLEEAGIQDESHDLIISNCVVNLSPDKPRVLREAFRVLAPGGEFYFSDVYCDRRLPEEVTSNEVLWGECIAGALYIGDFTALAKKAGFADPRILSCNEINIHNSEMKDLIGNARFYSITVRLFKLEGMLEPACEDYGQIAIYQGSIKGHKHSYVLDDHHVFEKSRPTLVCGNTAAMLGENKVSWLHPHFQVLGDRSVHHGAFDCSPKIAPLAPSEEDGKLGCGTGSCC